MPHSDPELRERIAEKIRERGCIEAESLNELKHVLGEDVSNTKFSQALRSLHYNLQHRHMGVQLVRPIVSAMDYEPRGYRVVYAPA